MRADIRVLAEHSAGLGVGLRVGIDMHPVGMEPRGKLGILIDQAGHAVALHKLHKGRGAGLIDRRIVAAQEARKPRPPRPVPVRARPRA